MAGSTRLKQKTLIIALFIFLVLINISCSERGKRTDFYPNGSKKSEYYEINGKLEGELKRFYESGELAAVETYKNGVLTDTTVEYYKNGNVKARIPYSAGLRNGMTAYYYSNGLIEEKGNYDKGKANGRFKFYHENGRVGGVEEVKNDSTIHFIHWDKNQQFENSSHDPYVKFKDTIYVGDEAVIEIGFVDGIFDKLSVTIGQINPEKTALIDSLQVLEAEVNFLMYKVQPNNAGEYKVTGLIADLLKIDSDSSKIGYIRIPFIFDKKFYVKERANF